MTHAVRFHTAILSLSLDLIDPDAMVIPVAAFTVGEMEGELAAALVMPGEVRYLARRVGSRFVAEVLATLPDSLYLQITDMLDHQGPQSIDEVILHLVEMFQNTVSVSSVERDQARDADALDGLDASGRLQRALSDAALEAYDADIKARLEEKARRSTRPSMRSWPLAAEAMTDDGGAFACLA